MQAKFEDYNSQKLLSNLHVELSGCLSLAVGYLPSGSIGFSQFEKFLTVISYIKHLEQENISRIHCLEIQTSTCSCIFNWMNEWSKTITLHHHPQCTGSDNPLLERFRFTHILFFTLKGTVELASLRNKDKMTHHCHLDLLRILLKTYQKISTC